MARAISRILAKNSKKIGFFCSKIQRTNTTNWFRMVLLCDMSNIESKKANIPGILTGKINVKMDEKSIFFDKKSKFQNACPPLPVNRMS